MTSFNEAEAITPRIFGLAVDAPQCLQRFNEAEAITPRIGFAHVKLKEAGE